MRSLLAIALLCLSIPAYAAEPADPHRFGPGRHFLDSQTPQKVTKASKGYAKHVRREKAKTRQQAPVSQAEAIRPRVVQYGPPPGCPARAWCGCWLQKHLGLNDRSLWLARNWARIGSPAGGPAPGVVAVFARGRGGHVGIVTGVPGPGRIVLLSGNDGRAVRERERSTRGVIAWRHVGARYAQR
jgi:uncharacterized protein (TIGR02594 family)